AVELEPRRSVSMAREPSRIAFGQLVLCDLDQLCRRSVEENHARCGKLGEIDDLPLALELAAERTEIRSERLGDRMRATFGARPIDDVPGQREHHPDRG